MPRYGGFGIASVWIKQVFTIHLTVNNLSIFFFFFLGGGCIHCRIVPTCSGKPFIQPLKSVPNVSFETVSLINNSFFPSFKERSSTVSSFYASLSSRGLMTFVVCPQGVSQAPQHFCLTMGQKCSKCQQFYLKPTSFQFSS